MSGFFAFLGVLALIGFIVGLIKPELVIRWGTSKARKQVIIYYGIGFIVLMAISGALNDEKSSATKDDDNQVVANKTQEQEIQEKIGTPDQIQFHTTIKEFKEKYNDAPNELKKSAVYREMVSFLKSYLQNGKIVNWEGKLTKIGTDEGGKNAYVVIDSEFNDKEIQYGTCNNTLSDYGVNSMISLNSSVYRDIEKISEGDEVIFTAKFIADEKRGFNEQSLTEEGFITDPNFTLKFVSIKKK